MPKTHRRIQIASHSLRLLAISLALNFFPPSLNAQTEKPPAEKKPSEQKLPDKKKKPAPTAREVARVALKSGNIILRETEDGSHFLLDIAIKPLPKCSAEMIENPSRVVVQCAGEVFSGAKDLGVTNSKVVSKLRFGSGTEVSRLILDVTAPRPDFVGPQPNSGALIVILRRVKDGANVKQHQSPSPKTPH